MRLFDDHLDGGASVNGRGPELLITIEEAARRLSISRSYIYLLLRARTIPSIKIGDTRRIAVKDLEAFIDRLRDDERIGHTTASLRSSQKSGSHRPVDGRMSTPLDTEVTESA